MPHVSFARTSRYPIDCPSHIEMTAKIFQFFRDNSCGNHTSNDQCVQAYVVPSTTARILQIEVSARRDSKLYIRESRWWTNFHSLSEHNMTTSSDNLIDWPCQFETTSFLPLILFLTDPASPKTWRKVRHKPPVFLVRLDACAHFLVVLYVEMIRCCPLCIQQSFASDRLQSTRIEMNARIFQFSETHMRKTQI